MGDLDALLKKVEESVEKEDKEELSEKFLKGDFTLVDLHKQINMMRKLGPLSKVMERQREINYSYLSKIIDSCISSVKIDNHEAFDKSIKEIFEMIKSLDQKFNLYVQEVINQGQVKKGCKLCEHGISIARASEILGISQWELMNYVGKTTLVDQYSFSSNVKARLKFARSLFQ